MAIFLPPTMLANTAFDPNSISGMIARYRADQGITIATGVSQWNDISGNARHLLQATGANQPAFGASSGPNSQPGVTFTGSPQFMATSTFAAIAQPLHAFLIVKTTALSLANNGVLSGGSVNERFLVVNVANTSMLQYFGTVLSINHADTTNFYLWEVIANGASSSMIRGNGAASTGAAGSTSLTGVTLGLLTGNGTYCPCVISEVIIYNSAIAGANLTGLRSYFSGRYGVATN